MIMTTPNQALVETASGCAKAGLTYFKECKKNAA